MAEANGVKALDPETMAALDRSVQLPVTDEPQTSVAGLPYLFFIAQAVDEMVQWGTMPKLRDQQLREFIPAEPIFASSLATIASRNASFGWKIEGPEAQVNESQRVLQQANFGNGWADYILRLSIDLYTTDNGAWTEVIREEDRPDAPLMGIANLDSLRCWPTGHPDVPCIYLDRNNKYHYMKWYQVFQIREMPATWEMLPGMQYCALTRILRAVQTHRDVGIYMAEKIGGNNTRAITALRGIEAKDILNAQQNQEFVNAAKGRLRYSNPIFVSSVDPKAEVGFETLEIASIPDHFVLDEQLKWYIAQIALGFLSDYQEFAPLPGGGLGTASQSETQHNKSRGKGAALFQKLVAQPMNWTVLPQAVEFVFDEQDLSAEGDEALVRKTRAEERDIRIKSMEISPVVARMQALEAGDLTQEQFDLMEQEDRNREAMEMIQSAPAPDPEGVVEEGGTPESQTDSSGTTQEEGEKARDDRAGPSSRTRVEEETTDLIAEEFDNLLDTLLKRNGLAEG